MSVRRSSRIEIRPVAAPAVGERYDMDITIDEQTEKYLRRLQQLLKREIPSGDPGLILERALALLLGTWSRERSVPGRVDSRPLNAEGTEAVTGDRWFEEDSDRLHASGYLRE